VVGALICNSIDGDLLNVMTTRLLPDFGQRRRRKSGTESRIFAATVLLRGVADLVFQVAGFVIAAKLAQRCLVQLEQSFAQPFGFGVAGCEILSVTFRSVRIRVFPCWR